MNIEPIPFEPYRYLVGGSEANAYVVDLQYIDDGNRKPAPFCGCPDFMARGNKACKHIVGVTQWELERINA